MLALAGILGSAALSQAPDDPGKRINLWDGGVPGFENRAAIPEESASYWTKSVNNPSITYFAPWPGRETGTAVIVVPGGAHEFLVTTTEGADVARWFTQRGVAAFVLRYRLSRQKDQPWTIDNSRQDTERAVRLVRSRAQEFGIDPHRVGIIGFSAGGELARMTLLSAPVPPPGNGDAVDALSARPDFGILVFPGPMKADEHITSSSPPLLLSAASDDTCCSQPVIDLMEAYRKANASAELHLYAAGGHAYNMGESTPMVSLRNWPDRITDWMTDRGLLHRRGK
ncbi:alpha/beta hydrolase fold domain-containing protein [Porphyrobacter algicida]|uniref:Alpha/beta hydrolase fold domain-containing protein n=2 Tax=Qipengyuania algicida TaxID=1836209 RepID=A0A845AQ44_9SPHN|nr:alpha/beta hydrolase fold domain-containing protein [Qipengyuania algicida]